VLSAESTIKAWPPRDRVSDREKFFIDFTYDRQVTGNLDKAYQIFELWLQTYPRGNRDPKPEGLVGGISTHRAGCLLHLGANRRPGIVTPLHSDRPRADFFSQELHTRKGELRLTLIRHHGVTKGRLARNHHQ